MHLNCFSFMFSFCSSFEMMFLKCQFCNISTCWQIVMCLNSFECNRAIFAKPSGNSIPQLYYLSAKLFLFAKGSLYELRSWTV